MTLTSDPFTLNVCGTSGVTSSTSVPKWSEIEQAAAELQRYKNLKLGRTPTLYTVLYVTVDGFLFLNVLHGPITHSLSKFERNRTTSG